MRGMTTPDGVTSCGAFEFSPGVERFRASSLVNNPTKSACQYSSPDFGGIGDLAFRQAQARSSSRSLKEDFASRPARWARRFMRQVSTVAMKLMNSLPQTE